jgi:hypothetical protein
MGMEGVGSGGHPLPCHLVWCKPMGKGLASLSQPLSLQRVPETSVNGMLPAQGRPQREMFSQQSV